MINVSLLDCECKLNVQIKQIIGFTQISKMQMKWNITEIYGCTLFVGWLTES